MQTQFETSPLAETSAAHKPKLVLVRPPSVSSKYDLSVSLPPPIGLAYLSASAKKAGFKAAVVDSIGEAPLQTWSEDRLLIYYGLKLEECAAKIPSDTDVIGVSVMFSLHWPMVKRLLKMIRSAHPHAFIILGGEHATALAEYSMEDAPELDACCLGEGEETIVDLLHALETKRSLETVGGLVIRKGGGTLRTGVRNRIKVLDDIPWPDWTDIPLRNYHKAGLTYGVVAGVNMPVLASRGCPYQCTFCSNPVMRTTRWSARSVDDLIDEMAFYMKEYGATDFSFYDLTAIVQREWIVQFCRTLLSRGMTGITWQLPSGTRSEALDAEVCDLLYRTGCRYLVYAPESASVKVLQDIKKKISLEKLEESMLAAVKRGMVVRFNIIIGFPDDTRSDLFASIKFIVRQAAAGATDVFLNIYSPYPGSELFDRLRKEGVIPEKLNDEYFHSLTFTNAFSVPEVRCNHHISIIELILVRSLGYVMFYGITYLSRPMRIFRTVKRVLSEKTESAFENALLKFLQKTGLLTLIRKLRRS